MALESLLTLFDSDVAAVADVQASNGAASRCNGWKIRDVADVADSRQPVTPASRATIPATAVATSATAEKIVTLQPKPAPLLGCTAATPATAENSNADGKAANQGAKVPDRDQGPEGAEWRHLQSDVAKRAALQANTGAGSSCNGIATSATAQIDTSANEPPAPPLHPSNRQQAETYLQRIGETDPAAVVAFLDGLARHPDRLQWLYRECLHLEIATPVVRAADLEQQAGELVRRFLADDERRTCRECRNLAGNGRCMAAGRGELPMTDPRYQPDPDRLVRCVGYLPDADDPDQRPGRERWPSLAKRLWQEQSQ